ncbi:nitroreductase family protein [Peptococcus simiae]|uniref:nitroreductase family protein n=1 Tax=Peptococcus simiae TaxID=1643805 RepID=UPI003981437D
MDLQTLLEKRRTYRKFDESKPLSPNDREAILQAVQTASSGMNRQSLRFISVESQEKVSQVFDLTHWAASLPPELGQPKPGERPVYFVAVCAHEKSSPFVDVDKGLAISNMTLTAMDRGIGSCIIGNFNHKKMQDLLGIGEDYTCNLVLAFGYPTITSTIKEVAAGEDLSYYLDDDGQYIVPKLKIEDLVRRV